jgi:arginine N-succinyltransferase
MIRFEIRGATLEDEEQILGVAGFLNTVNLPADRDHIHRLLEQSEKSFSGELRSLKQRKYVFVLRDLEADSVVGTSMIVAQLGRRDAPYVYFDVLEEEKYSRALDRHFEHTLLRIGFSYNGPTEIGGLVVRPDYRRAGERLGQSISYVRFLYIATHRELFQGEILAELLPPLEADGTSHLWESLGRHFTGLSYREADLLSSENKDFVRDLFPSGGIYASLLSPEARSVIGKVGPQTKGVEKLLRRIGFRYAHRIDPFDGGPHFVAPVEEISLVRDSRKLGLAGVLEGAARAETALVARELESAPYFRAINTGAAFGEGGVRISPEAAAQLGAGPGDELLCLPLR